MDACNQRKTSAGYQKKLMTKFADQNYIISPLEISRDILLCSAAYN